MVNEKKKGTNLLRPIGFIVLVVVVIGFVRWALHTNQTRNAQTFTSSDKPAH